MQLVLCGWLAVAPALTACACPPQPKMGCEGKSHCCCPEEKTSQTCSRAASYVDDLDASAGGADLAAPVTTLFTADLPLVVAASPILRAPDEAPLRGSPARPRHLLYSVLLV